MHALTEDELAQLKKIELDILIEIDRVCRENHIPYSLAWGTLIGAVRHKGFIPWDDDIDIMMERRYYDKFCKIVDGALGKNFVFVDYKRYEDYGLPFSKVAAKNTLMLEASSQYARIHHGVWVDIFPIDETSDDLKKRQKQYDRAQAVKSVMLCKGHYYFGQTGIKKLIYTLRRKIYRFCDKKNLTREFEMNAKKYSKQKGKYLLSLCGNAGVNKNTYDRNAFKKYIELEFEGHKFMAISGYDSLLRTTYGDYMKLPSAEQQIPHHYVEKLDFSKWK